MHSNHDRWESGNAYEVYMGRWSRAVAQGFIRWLEAPPGLDWLDVGCGTGALTRTIALAASPRSVSGCDPSPAFIAYARSGNADARVNYYVAGLENLPPKAGGYGAIVSGLVLNFLPDPVDSLHAMRERLAPGGVLGAYVWDYGGRMDFLRIFWEVVTQLDEQAGSLDEAQRFPLCRAENLESAFRQAGLGGVRSAPIEIQMVFERFEDYWQPFLAGTGPAPGYVASLTEQERQRLVEALGARLTPSAGGAIEMVARAWAVCGVHE